MLKSGDQVITDLAYGGRLATVEFVYVLQAVALVAVRFDGDQFPIYFDRYEPIVLEPKS